MNPCHNSECFCEFLNNSTAYTHKIRNVHCCGIFQTKSLMPLIHQLPYTIICRSTNFQSNHQYYDSFTVGLPLSSHKGHEQKCVMDIMLYAFSFSFVYSRKEAIKSSKKHKESLLWLSVLRTLVLSCNHMLHCNHESHSISHFLTQSKKKGCG